MADTAGDDGDGAGLLEQPALTVRPADGAGRRAILGPGGEEVGSAARVWLGWWWGHAVAVRERRDSPLVFTVARRWLLPLRRAVYDADGEPVGELAGRRVLGRWGDPVMRVTPGGLADLRGAELARWAGAGEVRLEFAEAARHDPFARMLALAAALVYG